jgi:hypothetical protein
VEVWRGGESVTVVTNAGDPAGAVARAMNLVLDVLPGETEHGDFAVTEPPERMSRRPPGSRRA